MASELSSPEINSSPATSQNTHLEDHVKALNGLTESIQMLREGLTQLEKTQESSKQALITKILEIQRTQMALNTDLNSLSNSTNDLKLQFTLFRVGQEKLESLAISMNQRIEAVAQWQQDKKLKQEQKEEKMRKEKQRKQEELQVEERRVCLRIVCAQLKGQITLTLTWQA
jgi:hypothetical protein